MADEELFFMSATTQGELTAYLNELCEQTGRIALQYFRQPIEVERKRDASPVTEADRNIELALRDAIATRFPHHQVLGEEFGGSVDVASPGPLWVLDPIDGTKNFITGKPLFGTLIGVCTDSVPRAGVIDMPALNERWIAPGDGVTYGLRGPSRVSRQVDLKSASLYATTPDMFKPDELTRFDALSAHVAFRSFGADCYGYALLAEGFVDLVVESALHAHDFCALAPVIEGAGGIISDWSGEPLRVHSQGQVIAAATPDLHDAALTFLNRGG